MATNLTDRWALMQLLGQANWWMPHWLDRAFPRLDAELASETAES